MGTIYDAFHSAKSTAANIPQPGEQGSYTIPAFLEDYHLYHTSDNRRYSIEYQP